MLSSRITLISVAFAGFVAFAAMSSPALAETVLRCQGFDRSSNGAIEHQVVIDGSTATVDGVKYEVTVSQFEYRLDRGPIRITINRSDGSYAMYNFYNIGAGYIDWSRPSDAGCTVATPRF